MSDVPRPKGADRAVGELVPDRSAPSKALTERFSKQKRVGTVPEMALRRELHRRGLRFRVQPRVEGLPRRRPDVAFTRYKVAVFIDGCFWHACPDHCVIPKANRDWWLWKFKVNEQRDRDTDNRLKELGWVVIRVWEHESPAEAADRIQTILVSQ